MATGGIGGVHRGFPHPPDVSADLAQLARTPALVVSAGVKSLLDVPATAELLESLGVPVLGFRVDTLPLFYGAAGGPPVSARVESAEEAARVAAAHWELGGAGLLLGRPPDEPLEDVEPLDRGGTGGGGGRQASPARRSRRSSSRTSTARAAAAQRRRTARWSRRTRASAARWPQRSRRENSSRARASATTRYPTAQTRIPQPCTYAPPNGPSWSRKPVSPVALLEISRSPSW